MLGLTRQLAHQPASLLLRSHHATRQSSDFFFYRQRVRLVKDGLPADLIDEASELLLCPQVQAKEVLQTAQEAVRALHVPFHREWALSAYFDIVVEGFQMSCLLIKALILSEFVLEAHCEIVHFALLVEYHFEAQFVDFSSLV